MKKAVKSGLKYLIHILFLHLDYFNGLNTKFPVMVEEAVNKNTGR